MNAPCLSDGDVEALHRAERATRERGEPTEYEAIFWRFEGPFTDGWVVRVMWDHHDGEIELAFGHGLTLAEAINKALDAWKES